MIKDFNDAHSLFSHVASSAEVDVNRINLNPILEEATDTPGHHETWKGLMYLYENQTRLQILATSVKQLDILPIESDLMNDAPVETEVDFYSSWLSRYNKHLDPLVGYQITALARALFSEGYEVRCREWNRVAEQLGVDLDGVPYLAFPLMMFTHPENDIKFLVNCEPIMLK